ncbi:MAG: phosphatidate cytidylyltransferase [Xanthomonadales bacterium]|nr:phosphatidate cytidylyltransferase [Xanthomonadales bacterium]
MTTRVATGLVLAPAVVLAIVFLPPLAFATLVSVLMLAGFWEWTRLSGMSGRPLRVLVLTGLAAVFAGLAWRIGTAGLVLLAWVACGFWLFALAWLRWPRLGAAGGTLAVTLKVAAGALLLSGAWAGAVLLRDHLPQGPGWLIACLAVVYGGDSFAYFSGRLFGDRKLAPSISPGKTWAGLYGALVGTVPVALVAGWLLGQTGTGLVAWLLLAMLCLMLSVQGDLIESVLKRQAGVKDSGRLFPGHGGVLDRGDSLFAALPAFAVGLHWLLA